MRPVGTHEQIRLKIVAFLFNQRVDALRGEMYRALCLHVLGEVGEPCTCEQIAELIAYDLSANVTDGLRAVVSDELRRLVEAGSIVCEAEQYSVNEHDHIEIPDEAEQEQLSSTILKELRGIAVTLNPNITEAQLNSLLDFYLEISDIVARYQLGFISTGHAVQQVVPNVEEISTTVAECTKRYAVDKFLDVDEFVHRTLVRPTEVLSEYLHRLIQVNVIMQILSWDPDLAYLQNKILSGKILHIDSNVLFSLMQTTHPQHQFLSSLLRATHNDLGVQLLVHENTIREYHQPIEWANEQFDHFRNRMRDVAETCKRHNERPADYIEESVFVDYMSNNLDHIDPGTWQKYLASITADALISTLKTFSIKVDKTSVYVPDDEFNDIKDALIRASRLQMDRGKRSYVKIDPAHDAQMCYWITSARRKKDDGGTSLGYDRYLLTLDGSLTHFANLRRIPLTETFFIYPNQWYELAFPFLRIRTSENAGFAAGLTSLIFSGVFPTLMSLIPLELCGYVFDQGGKGLPMGAIRNVVEGLVEERLVDSLDPANQDRRKNEEAKLQVQRLVAKEVLKRQGTVQKLEEKTQALKEEQGLLETSVEQLRTSKEDLTTKIVEKEVELGTFAGIDKKIETIRSDYERRLAEQEAKHISEINRLQTLEREKENALAAQNEKLNTLQETVKSVEQKLKDDQEERKRTREERKRTEEEQEERHRRQLAGIKKFVVTALMLFGLVTGTGLLFQFGIDIRTILLSILLLGLGLALYHLLTSPWLSLATYGLGVLLAGGTIIVQKNLQTWQWIIPVALDILIFAIDRIIDRQTVQQ